MRKILSWMLVVPLVLSACSKETEVDSRYEGDPDKGALVIRNASVSEVEVVTTRADADVNGFTLTVQDESDPANVVKGLFSSFANGRVEGLTPSAYTVTLTSHPDGFTPGFDDAWYEAVETNVSVEKATNTSINLEAVQANSGVRFVYDESLTKIGEVIPMITQGTAELVYQGTNKDATGYYLPQNATLTIKKADNTYLTIGGEASQILELQKEQLWEITLRGVAVPETGSITINATVKVISEPNVFREFVLGEVQGKALVDITGPKADDGSLRFTEADFRVFGENVTAARYGTFTKASVDAIFDDPENTKTLEDLMQFNGNQMSAEYLAQLNSATGWGITYINLTPGVAYSFIIMPTKEGEQIAYRVDFTTLVPTGDFTTGDYSVSIVGNPDFDFSGNYTNYMPITIAGNNFYHVGDTDGLTYADCLFELPAICTANYQPENNELVFTGYDTDGYYVLDEIAWYLNKRAYFGAVVMFDEQGNHMVPQVWVTDASHKAIKPKGSLFLMAYDVTTEEELGWVEKIADGAEFSYTPFTRAKISAPINGMERIETNKKLNKGLTDKPEEFLNK